MNKLPTLTIDPRLYDIGLSLKGLSFKAMKQTQFEGSLCRADDSSGQYYLDLRIGVLHKDKFISLLKQLHERIPFGKIKIIGHYELSGEQLMEEILKQQ